ncbi:hypothetical protein [Streptomyces sp. NPDC057966]|uniref:hypothetical protein n=1 Tax=Streptomyces sp. NPDC057966 TaxID=3346292 RepID=UPI0036E0BAB5
MTERVPGAAGTKDTRLTVVPAISASGESSDAAGTNQQTLHENGLDRVLPVDR